jgi:glyoxylase-like metal-dependent hydrolase (beta-lactamase superfamily II)
MSQAETKPRTIGQQKTSRSLGTSQPSVKHCTDTVNARHVHGRPEHELVPSRYALKVGKIDVTVVSDGVLSLPGSMLGHNADPTVRAAWLDEKFLPPDVLEWALNVVLVRSGDQTILVDAGIGAEFPDLKRAGQLVRRLDDAGIDLSSVTDVVLTHLHMDHIGGLLVDGVKEQLRPDLRIHVAAAEVKFWAETPDFSRVSMPPGFPDALRRTAKRFLQVYRSQLRTFEDEYEVAPGVRAQRTGGHTPGHCVVRLASGGQRLTFAGDAVFQVGFEHPDWYNGFEHDPEESARVRVNLLRELAANRESLLATHLSFPSVCHVAVDGDVFRWVPGPWEY